MLRYPQRVVAAGALIVYGSSAMAQITATGPFTGTFSETWESFNNYTIPPSTSPNYLSSPTSVFGGAATISNSFMAVYEPNAAAGFSLGLNGDALVADGAKGMGIDDSSSSSTTITFASDVSAFGGYWGNYGLTLGGGSTTLTFFDASGNVLGSDSFLYDHTATSNGVLDWHGWQFAGAGIRSLTYQVILIVNDGLQASSASVAPIPEPEIYAMMLAGLGILGFAARRRKILQECVTA
jgi:hypothetical protein